MIAVARLAGIALSLACLAIAPKWFEASAQIGAANNISPLVVNVEDPALLISRLLSLTPVTHPKSWRPAVYRIKQIPAYRSASLLS